MADAPSVIIGALSILSPIAVAVMGYFVRVNNKAINDIRVETDKNLNEAVAYLERRVDERADDANKRITDVATGYIDLTNKHSGLSLEIARNMFTRGDAEKLQKTIADTTEKNRLEVTNMIKDLDGKMEKIINGRNF
jgi:hypothetical protein